jgi:hypothetical protein
MRPNASMWQDPDYSATLTLWASLYALAEKLIDDSVKSIVLEYLFPVLDMERFCHCASWRILAELR